MNQGGRFVDALDPGSPLHASDHGVQWADFDRDGDLDLSLTETFPDDGRHRLLRNELPREAAERSLQVQVVDRAGRRTRRITGVEPRLWVGRPLVVGPE